MRFHNLVVSTVKIAHAQMVLLSNDISEVTPLPLRILYWSSTNDGHSLCRGAFAQSVQKFLHYTTIILFLWYSYSPIQCTLLVLYWWSGLCKPSTLGVHSGSQGVQHVTIGILPPFSTDPTCKTLNRFKFCTSWGKAPEQQLHVQDWGGWMPHNNRHFQVSISENL